MRIILCFVFLAWAFPSIWCVLLSSGHWERFFSLSQSSNTRLMGWFAECRKSKFPSHILAWSRAPWYTAVTWNPVHASRAPSNALPKSASTEKWHNNRARLEKEISAGRGDIWKQDVTRKSRKFRKSARHQSMHYGKVSMGGVAFAFHWEFSTLPLIFSAYKYFR